MTPVSVTASKSHNDTAVVDAPKEAVFGYLAQIENLPEWATEFAPELKDDQGDAMQQGSGPRCCTGPGPVPSRPQGERHHCPRGIVTRQRTVSGRAGDDRHARTH